jgi:hypothetical protein
MVAFEKTEYRELQTNRWWTHSSCSRPYPFVGSYGGGPTIGATPMGPGYLPKYASSQPSGRRPFAAICAAAIHAAAAC